MGFQNSPPERSACFYLTITGSFECYQYFLWLWNKFSGKRKPFPKNGIPFLVGITKIEHLVFSCKTTCNAKTNRMGSTK